MPDKSKKLFIKNQCWGKMIVCLFMVAVFFISPVSGEINKQTKKSGNRSYESTAIPLFISISAADSVIMTGANITVNAFARFSDNSFIDITSSVNWQSSDNRVADVGKTGLLTAKKAGMVIVTATYCKISADFTLRVSETLENDDAPGDFKVYSPEPNPFSSFTKIRYTLPDDAYVYLAILDSAGKRVSVISDGIKRAGINEAVWDGKNFSGIDAETGTYTYRINAYGYTRQGKIMLLR